MKSTLKDFEGVNPWHLERVYTEEIKRAGVVDQVIDAGYTLEDMPDNIQKATGQQLMQKLIEKGSAVILCAVMRGNGMHQVSIGVKMHGERAKMAYMDSSGDLCKQDVLPTLQGIIKASKLEGRVDFHTSIPVQQRLETQPNTCVFWSLKNAEDFIKGKEIQGFGIVEADEQIKPYLDRYTEKGNSLNLKCSS